MTSVRRTVAVLLTWSIALTACSSPDSADRPAPAASSPSDAVTSSPAGQQTAAPSSQPTTQENGMRLTLTIGDQQFQATLDDSAAARDLAAQLPLTVEMRDHGSVEKTGPLPSPLSLDGQPAGADPSIGDVGYYAPFNNLVLYYGNQSYHDGIVVLGRLDGDAAQRIAAIDGSLEVRLQA
ncbi:cyclophilin-like fold protein [Kribbella sp. CA-253562]|uniref:cyclophilin-like fold protein n=1 Tax=Kribbella sp. CA-253562 TaxID=3239942 RepID=UPI003D9478E5